MTENTLTLMYISIILQLIYDGQADLEQISPNVLEFIMGIIETFEETPEGEEKELLYFAANKLLGIDKNKLN